MSTNINNILVSDVMLATDSFPIVSQYHLIRETLETMNKFKLGIACIVDSNNKLLAVITDGDLRRILLASQKPLASFFVDDVLDYSSSYFKFVEPNLPLKVGIDIMGNHKIWDLPVVDNDGSLLGLLHLHPAINAVINKTMPIS